MSGPRSGSEREQSSQKPPKLADVDAAQRVMEDAQSDLLTEGTWQRSGVEDGKFIIASEAVAGRSFFASCLTWRIFAHAMTFQFLCTTPRKL